LAADFIRFYCPSVEKPPKRLGQGFAHTHRREFTWMDERVREPREFGGIECPHQSIAHASHPLDVIAAGLGKKPN
jgi:hypothetical protein